MDYNARYYSAVLGRFISPDTIVPDPTGSSGFNRYRYARSNPLKYADPSGNIECEFEICKTVEADIDEVLPDVYTSGIEWGGAIGLGGGTGYHTVYDFPHNQKAESMAFSGGLQLREYM
jgi:uncharacterized protein RhaS with RHS repeats